MAATMVMLIGLGAVAGLTVMSVKRSLGGTSQQRLHAQAINAAESGLVVAGKFLRDRLVQHPTLKFTPELQEPALWNTTYGAGLDSGPVEVYPFGLNRLGYDIAYRNNDSDPGGPTVDTDGVVVIMVTGCTSAVSENGKACEKASGARALIEVEVAGEAYNNGNSSYAQQGQNELGNAQSSQTISNDFFIRQLGGP